MKMFVLFGLLYLSTLMETVAEKGVVRPDTTQPGQFSRRPVQVILPGRGLDTSMSSLAKPDPMIYQVVPTWLRAKAAGKPVYVVDGETATAGQLKGLKAEAVASVRVIEGKRAAALYGSVARPGVVVITTKAALQPHN